MHITVTGTNLDLTEGIKDEAITKLSKVQRLFDRFLDMEVAFTEETNPRIADKVHCEVVLHAKGTYLRASAAAPDALTAIDRVEKKLLRQVRKFKTRLVSRPRLASANSPGHAG